MLTASKCKSKSPFVTILHKTTKKIGGNITLLDKDSEESLEDAFDQIDELNDEYQFQIVPNKNKERDVLYVCGMSGSGKSYFIKEYVKQYMKEYPKHHVYLFSFLAEDETLDEITKITRININHPEFMDDEITHDDFKDALVIFDDIDCIPDKKLKKKVYNLLQQILQVGRHNKTSVCFACHEVCNSNETKPILNECHSISIPVRTMGNKKLQYVLEGYFGFDKNDIQKFKSVDSRFTTIFKTYPKVIVGEKEIYLM